MNLRYFTLNPRWFAYASLFISACGRTFSWLLTVSKLSKSTPRSQCNIVTCYRFKNSNENQNGIYRDIPFLLSQVNFIEILVLISWYHKLAKVALQSGQHMTLLKSFDFISLLFFQLYLLIISMSLIKVWHVCHSIPCDDRDVLMLRCNGQW